MEDLFKKWEEYKIPKEIIQVFREIPREEFLIPDFKEQAKLDIPLPILRGKTISQPTTVLLMTQALDIKKGMKIFEVGTGSGYQTAILSKLVGEKGKIITCEILPELVNFARENLNKLQVKNVKILEKDGSQGFKEESPYDRIIITAACPKIPEVLIDQLKTNGIVVAPVGSEEGQIMKKIIKVKNGLVEEKLGSFLFSPMTGKYGFQEEL